MADNTAQSRFSYAEGLPADAAIQAVLSGSSVDHKDISGGFERKNLRFTEHVIFSNCNFTDRVDLGGCRFEHGIEFIGCEFAKPFSMEACRVEGDCHFRACVFKEEARFERLQVNGKLEVRAPRNNSELTKNVHTFCDRPWVIFEGYTTFSQIHIYGEANFGSAQFEKGIDFYNAWFEGPVFFRKDRCRAFERAKEEAERRSNTTVKVTPLEVDPTAFPDFFPVFISMATRRDFAMPTSGGS